MDMSLFVPAAGMPLGTAVRMSGIHLDDVFVHVPGVRVVEVAIMKVVDVVAVLDSGVAAAWAVLVGVVGVDVAVFHRRIGWRLIASRMGD